MKNIAAFFLCVMCFVSAAHASVTVKELVLQKGLYVKANCVADPADPAYDGCKCDADIRYPQIEGLADMAAQVALNASFKHDAEQAQCEGDVAKDVPKAASDKKEEKSPSSASHHYEITFQSDAVLGLKFTDWGYTGGAHGNGSVTGIIIDLAKGKILALGDIIVAQNIAGVNTVIYNTLSAKPEGEVFRDQIESRKESFIDKGQCQGCTLVLEQNGLNVVFQTYEVASFAQGNMEVGIPSQYIIYPAISAALTNPNKANMTETK